jgi:hypothetical protein
MLFTENEAVRYRGKEVFGRFYLCPSTVAFTKPGCPTLKLL